MNFYKFWSETQLKTRFGCDCKGLCLFRHLLCIIRSKEVICLEDILVLESFLAQWTPILTALLLL